MREKPLNEEAIRRTIHFLKLLKNHCDDAIPFSLTGLVKLCGVASGTGKACRELVIISTTSKDLYKWEIKMTSISSPDKDREEVYRHLAISIKDKLLHKNKKTIHTPLMPDWASIANSLVNVSEKLNTVISLQERLLINHKNPQITNEPADLFRVDDQRLLVVTALLPTIHSNQSFI